MRAIRKHWFLTGLAVLVVIVFGVWTVQAQLAGIVTAWSGSAFWTAQNALMTGVEAAAAACLAGCHKLWTVATVTAAVAGEIAATIIYYGVPIGVAGLAAYMIYKGWTWDSQNSRVMVPGATTYSIQPGAPGVGNFACYYNGNNCVVGVCGPTCTTGSCASKTHGSSLYGGWSSPWGIVWEGTATQSYVCTGNGAYVTANQGMEPGTINGMKSTIETDLGSADSTTKQKARDAVAAATAVAAPGLKEWRDTGVPPLGIPGSAWQTIADRLAAALPQAKVQQLSDLDSAAYTTNPQTSSMTKTDYRDAVRDGVEQALNEKPITVNVPPMEWGAFSGGPVDPEVTPPPPEKPKELTEVLTDSFTQWEALPMVSWVSDWEIQVSGVQSSIDLPMPSIGGSQASTFTLDFSSYEWILVFIGNMLLSITGIRWTMWLFMGRGDG